jgi:hypothetical protein
MGNLASTYCNQGRWKEAEELEVKVMDKRKRVLGQEHPDTLTSMDNLVSTYNSLGKLNEAKILFVEVSEIRNRVGGGHQYTDITNYPAFLGRRVLGKVSTIAPVHEIPEIKQALKDGPVLSTTHTQCETVKKEPDPLSLPVLLPEEIHIPGSWPREHISNRSMSIEFTPYEVGCLDQIRVMLEEKLNIGIFWWSCDSPIRLEPGTKLLKMTWTCVRSRSA